MTDIETQYLPPVPAVLAPSNHEACVAVARALCPFAENMTDLALLSCVAVVEAKGSVTLAGSWLAYEEAALRRHIQSDLGRRVMQVLAREKVTGVGYVKALSALEDVASSVMATEAARVSAAKQIIKIKEDADKSGANVDSDGKELNAMSMAELEQLVEALKANIPQVGHVTS